MPGKQVSFRDQNHYDLYETLKKDLFIRNKNTNISFKGTDGPSKETLDYIRKTQDRYYFEHEKEIDSLKHFDLEKIKDICKGISVFEGWDAKDLAIATNNLEGILLQRGCSHQCTHCGDCSHHKITTMNWDNVKDFLDGAGELKKRLGFNPFQVKIEYKYCFVPFEDSDPMLLSMKDSNGNKHNIFDFAKEFYEKTGTKLYLTTAGWEKGNENAQKAAEQLAEHPEYISYFVVSVHPFHSYLARSRKFKEQGQDEKADYWRNKYVNMMANVLLTTAPLMGQINRYNLNSLRGRDNEIPCCTKDDLDKLYEDIFKRMNQIDPDFDTQKFSYNSFAGFYHPISYFGRAANLKNEDKSSRYYPIIMQNDEKSKIEELKKLYDSKSPSDIYDLTKMINTDGTILCKQNKPGGVNVDFAKMPIKLNFKHPTNWKSDYYYAHINPGLINELKDTL